MTCMEPCILSPYVWALIVNFVFVFWGVFTYIIAYLMSSGETVRGYTISPILFVLNN